MCIYNQLQKTTYQEVLSSVIGKDESIEEVSISITEPLLRKTETVTIDDQQVIKQLLEKDFKLKKSRVHEDIHKIISINTDKDNYDIYFGVHHVIIGGETYNNEDPGAIPIYDYILEHEFDWEITPR